MTEFAYRNEYAAEKDNLGNLTFAFSTALLDTAILKQNQANALVASANTTYALANVTLATYEAELVTYQAMLAEVQAKISDTSFYWTNLDV